MNNEVLEMIFCILGEHKTDVPKFSNPDRI